MYSFDVPGWIVYFWLYDFWKHLHLLYLVLSGAQRCRNQSGKWCKWHSSSNHSLKFETRSRTSIDIIMGMVLALQIPSIFSCTHGEKKLDLYCFVALCSRKLTMSSTRACIRRNCRLHLCLKCRSSDLSWLRPAKTEDCKKKYPMSQARQHKI